MATHVKNPKTGRLIKIGGRVHKKLLKSELLEKPKLERTVPINIPQKQLFDYNISDSDSEIEWHGLKLADFDLSDDCDITEEFNIEEFDLDEFDLDEAYNLTDKTQ